MKGRNQLKKLLAGLLLSFGLLFTSLQATEFHYPRQETVKLHKEGFPVGSGVILLPGFVLTAAHVADAPDLETNRSPSDIKGNVILNSDYLQNKIDLSLLWYSEGIYCPCVKLASREAEVDEQVIVVGYPMGLTQVLTEGRSQGVKRITFPTLLGEEDLGDRLVLTASAYGGNSGGGVFVYREGQWQLVGIVVQKAGNLTLAVPLKDIKGFLKIK